MSVYSDFITEDPEKHISAAIPFFRRLGLPGGFIPILTCVVKEGDRVYLHGSNRGIAHAYGPHTVVANDGGPTARAWLCNNRGTRFPVNSEELLVKTL